MIYIFRRANTNTALHSVVVNLFKHRVLDALPQIRRGAHAVHPAIRFATVVIQFAIAYTPKRAPAEMHPKVSLFLLLLFPLAAVAFVDSGFQTRSDAVSNVLTDYLCDLQRTFADTQRQVRDRADRRMRLLDQLAAAYAVDDRRVPWLLQRSESLVGEHIMWQHQRQATAWRHVLNETRAAQEAVRDHIGYYIHLDGTFPAAIADWRDGFAQITAELQAIGWKSNNDTLSYHAESFGRMRELNRLVQRSESDGDGGGERALNRTTAGGAVAREPTQWGQMYALTWRGLMQNARSEMRASHEKFGVRLADYAASVRAVGATIAKRLRKLNVINERCFCL